MEQIAVTYSRAGAAGPPRGEIRRTLPSRWEDLTPAQRWICMDMVVRGVSYRQLVEYLLQLPVFIQDRLSDEEVYDLLRCISWMEVDSTCTAPIAPYIDVTGGDRLYLPSDKFASVTCLEYVLLDELYTEYIVDQDPERELRLVAIVARPSGPSDDPASDPRVKLLSIEQTDQWMDTVRRLPESIRVYIITLISANRALVHEQYGHWLFTSTPAVVPDQDGGEIDTQPSDSGLNFGWWGAYLDVAADGVFGTYDQVLHTAFHTVCMHMVRKVEAARLRQQEHDHARARAGA